MAEKLVAEMTESELRQLIDERLHSYPLKVRFKIGNVEFEAEGSEEVIQRNLDTFLGSVNRSGIVSSTPIQERPYEEYDLSKDLTVAGLSGPVDLASRAEEYLDEGITARSGWTIKED